MFIKKDGFFIKANPSEDGKSVQIDLGSDETTGTIIRVVGDTFEDAMISLAQRMVETTEKNIAFRNSIEATCISLQNTLKLKYR